MKYEVYLSDEIDQRLMQKASETGEEVAQLIRVAVGRFVGEEVAAASNGDWSESVQARRCELIDKDIAGAITPGEQAELARLDHLANEHFDRVAPPPIEGAQRLHEQLLKNRANGN